MRRTGLYLAYALGVPCLILLGLHCARTPEIPPSAAAGSPAVAEDQAERAAETESAQPDQIWPPSAGDTYLIADTADDGTEAGGNWYPEGVSGGINRAGKDPDGTRYVTIQRFAVPDLEQGQEIAYARLRVTGRGAGTPREITFLVRGISADGTVPFSSEHLPSQQPLTKNTVSWTLHQPMKNAGTSLPIYFRTPDLAPIVNEILARPGWGEKKKTLTFLIDWKPAAGAGANYLMIPDRSRKAERFSPAVLEICPTIEDTFIAGPMLGRPTDRSVTINLMNHLDIDVYAEAGSAPGEYSRATDPLLNRKADHAIDLVIDGLEPHKAYYYRLRYRRAGNGEYAAGFEGSFRTGRGPGESFVFTIQADSHIVGAIGRENSRKFALYEIMLANVLNDRPDFHVDLGDFAHIEFYGGISANTYLDALDRYLVQRRFLGSISRSVPFFLVLGNHEGEEGWRTTQEVDSIEVWGTLARKQVIPNPRPDGFYSGGSDSTECCGLRESYYAWEWGDALFVVLDPFWYTMTMPHMTGHYQASSDAWDWTLGKEQYDWLYETLHRSGAKWKFVMAHHMTGGVLEGHEGSEPYGRGGIVAASYGVAGRPTFEWGGEDSTGRYVFDTMRPGWEHGPVHQVMVDGGVDIFFHGHDHVFVYETLDGIVYQECPVPAGVGYGCGFYSPNYYRGAKVNNSGHLRVMVSPDSVRVDYVRSVLPEDEPLNENGTSIMNASISYSYTIHK